MSVIISCSISEKQSAFVKEMGLSNSALLSRAINECMEISGVGQEEIKSLRKNITLMSSTLKKQGTFIDKHGLMQEYLTFEDV